MIKQETLLYTDGTQEFEGVICWDDALQVPAPGILVSHSFKGQSLFEVEKAVELAKMGYVAFALDMYGKGRRASEPEKARALMGELTSNRLELRNRILLALDTLRNQSQVDAERIGAIGFCFGGKCVLDLARSGADVKGVASFHGIFDPPGIEPEVEIKASVLVLHGWDDPLAKPHQVVALSEELTRLKADWQILAFGHTGHSFTNPASKAREDGYFYMKSASERSWKSMQGFLEEVL